MGYFGLIWAITVQTSYVEGRTDKEISQKLKLYTLRPVFDRVLVARSGMMGEWMDISYTVMTTTAPAVLKNPLLHTKGS